MTLDSRIRQMQSIYDTFEQGAAPYKKNAVCAPGCAYCCTHFGTVDITTLEGVVILRALRALPKKRAMDLLKKTDRNRRKKQKGETAVCPFLQKNRRCAVYDVRPFSCRQLYSVKMCGEQGPTVHRQVMALAGKAVESLKALDDTGYCGHISAILTLLQDRRFLSIYEAGHFRPEQVRDFGRRHHLRINRPITGS